MSSLNTSAVRIASILRDGFPSGFCVECLAAKLRISITEVRGAAQLLVARPGFRVCDRGCYTCGRTKDGVVAYDVGYEVTGLLQAVSPVPHQWLKPWRRIPKLLDIVRSSRPLLMALPTDCMMMRSIWRPSGPVLVCHR